MLMTEHERAQELADRADEAFAQADLSRAEELYNQAAELELGVFRSVPPEESRARAILGLSAAALLYHAGRFDEAGAIAGDLLKREDVPDPTRASLEEVLAAIPGDRPAEIGGRTDDSFEASEIRRRAETIETIYQENRDLMQYVALHHFRVPWSDAHVLIQDVFLDYLRAESHISDARSWLLRDMRNRCIHYWRWQTRAAEAERGSVEALASLPPRAREAVRLYFDGLTNDEIADKLDTTPRYAQLLVERALKRIV